MNQIQELILKYSKENSKLLIKDAISAGLKIKSFSGVSMLDVFQKKN